MSEGSAYVIRPACEADVDVLAGMRLRLQEHLLAGTPSMAPLSEWRMATLPEFYRECLADKCVVVAMSEDSDVPVAMLVGTVENLPSITPSLYGRIDDVWVDPEHRRRGLTKGMMRSAMEYFRERGVTQLVLNFAPGNDEARATWTGLGFVPFNIAAQAPLETVWEAVENNKRESASA